MSYLTVQQVAERLNVSEKNVRAWLRSGELRKIDVSQKRGKKPRYRVSEEELARFERSREVSPAPKSIPRRRALVKRLYT